MSNRKMTIRLLAGRDVRLRFDRANARHRRKREAFTRCITHAVGTIRLLARRGVRLRFDRADARHRRNAKRLRIRTHYRRDDSPAGRQETSNCGLIGRMPDIEETRSVYGKCIARYRRDDSPACRRRRQIAV